MRTRIVAIALTLMPTTLHAQSPNRANPVLKDCQLALLPENYIEISADKPGTIKHLAVREGTIVDEGAVIAQIDDVEAKMQLRVSEQKRLSALARAKDTIEEEYAVAARDAAQADYDALKSANVGGVDRVVPETELRAKKLEVTRAGLQIDKAKKDRQLAIYEYNVAKVEKEAAEMEIERRAVNAPFSGQVVELFRKQGEWVEPGEPILQFARYDVLQCDGYVDLSKYDPREIDGCEVTIEATVGLGRTEQAKGRIVYVEQQVFFEDTYTFRVVAEVSNRTDRGRWALYPGLPATMTIHLGTATTDLSRRVESSGPSVEGP